MNDVKIGQTASRELTVGKEHLACAVGSGSVEVFATPMVAAMMEGAAADLAQSFFAGRAHYSGFQNHGRTPLSYGGRRACARGGGTGCR